MSHSTGIPGMSTTGILLLDLFIRHSCCRFSLRPVKERSNMTSLYITIRTVTETIVPKIFRSDDNEGFLLYRCIPDTIRGAFSYL